jgi:hypothetical protein
MAPIIIPIGVDTSGLTRGLSQGTSGLRKFGKMAAIVGGAAALGGLVATVKVGIDEFMAAQKVVAQTGAVLKSTGRVANVTAENIAEMSSSLMELTGIDDEAIASGQNLLLTFTKIRNETGKGNNIFDQATLAMTNLSVAMGKDLSSSAILVGKALNDPVKGVGALSKAGVQFTADQKEMIKGLVESGDVMGAQKLILKELETQFGGSAEAAGKTLPGQLNILKETFRNTAADLIARFIPALTTASQKLLNFVREFAARPTFIGKVSFIVESIKDAAGKSYASLRDWWTESKTMVGPTGVVRVELSGSAEVRKGFRELRELAVTNGGNAGKDFADSFFERGIGGNAKALFGGLGEVVVGVFRFTGLEAALSFTGSFVNEFAIRLYERRGEIGDAIKRVFSNIDFSGAAKTLAKAIFVGPKAEERSNVNQFVGKVTKAVRQAVTAARAGMAGLGSALGGMLATITGTSSPDAKRAAEIRAQQKAEATTRERARLTLLRDSAATDEDLAQAKQDLADFELDVEATAAEDRVAIAQSANQRAIDDLIASFNRGEVGAKDFSTKLDAIIGANRGAELGIAFADAFTGALSALTGAATDIQDVVTASGKPLTQPVKGTPAADAARKAHADWKADRAARLKAARDFRLKKEPGEKTGRITKAEQDEIDDIMRKWDKAHPEPVRMAMGGILKRQVFTAGEAGPEAVIPLGSNSAMSMLRDAIGGGGGGGAAPTYNIVINAGLGTDPDELGRTIVETIKRYEKRNGAVFQGPIVTTLANAAGKTSTASAATDFNRAKTLRSG